MSIAQTHHTQHGNTETGLHNTPFLDDLFHDDTVKQHALNEQASRRRARLRLAANAILATDNGKRFLFWLINQTGVFAPCFTGNSTTFFLEGKRSVGLEIYRLLLETNPDAFQEIINFQRAEDAENT